MVLIIALILVLYLFGGFGQKDENYTNYQMKHFSSTYLDNRTTPSYHRYPFYGYSLYGLDDIPSYNRVKKYPPTTPWSKTVARRNSGHTGLTLDYVGLPSYFYRHYYRWP